MQKIFGEPNKTDEYRKHLGEVRTTISNALVGEIIITLSKLYDITSSPHVVHLKCLIMEAVKRAPDGEITKKKNEYLKRIEEIKKKLEALRNTSRAHNYPLKPDPYQERTWGDIKMWLEFGEEIFKTATLSAGEAWPDVGCQSILPQLEKQCDLVTVALKEMLQAPSLASEFSMHTIAEAIASKIVKQPTNASGE